MCCRPALANYTSVNQVQLPYSCCWFLPCSKGFFYRFSSFPPQKTDTSQSKFDLDIKASTDNMPCDLSGYLVLFNSFAFCLQSIPFFQTQLPSLPFIHLQFPSLIFICLHTQKGMDMYEGKERWMDV